MHDKEYVVVYGMSEVHETYEKVLRAPIAYLIHSSGNAMRINAENNVNADPQPVAS
jgi:hypothetical protein